MTLFHIIRQLPTLILSDLCWSFICMFSRGFSSVLMAKKSDSSWTLQSTRHLTSIETLKWLVIYSYYYLRTFWLFLCIWALAIVISVISSQILQNACLEFRFSEGPMLALSCSSRTHDSSSRYFCQHQTAALAGVLCTVLALNQSPRRLLLLSPRSSPDQHRSNGQTCMLFDLPSFYMHDIVSTPALPSCLPSDEPSASRC